MENKNTQMTSVLHNDLALHGHQGNMCLILHQPLWEVGRVVIGKAQPGRLGRVLTHPSNSLQLIQINNVSWRISQALPQALELGPLPKPTSPENLESWPSCSSSIPLPLCHLQSPPAQQLHCCLHVSELFYEADTLSCAFCLAPDQSPDYPELIDQRRHPTTALRQWAGDGA